MFDAFTSQKMRQAWWWPMFPGLALMVFMYSVYSVGRGFQRALRQTDSPNLGTSTRRVRRVSKRRASLPVDGGPPEYLVAVENLAVTYQPRTPEEKQVQAVKGVSFRLDAGEMLGIVGESGSGKTTAVRALLRLLPQPRTSAAGCGSKAATCMESEIRSFVHCEGSTSPSFRSQR